MRILVTGASGWIGRHLTCGLAARDHEIASFDLTYPHDRLPRHWPGDVRNRRTVEAALRAWNPDVVVHLAARYGRVWCENDKAATFDVNVTGTAVVAQACEKSGVRFVLASSSEVYGVKDDAPHAVRLADELHELRPLNTYGESKLMAEKAARRIVSPERLSIWRLNMPYGPGGLPGDSGVPGFGYNALHTWMWQAANGLDLTVHRGTSRSWTFVDDTVNAMAMLLEQQHCGTVNVCSSRDMRTSYDTAALVLAHAPGSTSKIIEADPPAGVTPWKQLDDSALFALGWRPTVALPDGIERTIGYMARFDVSGRWAGEKAPAASAR